MKLFDMTLARQQRKRDEPIQCEHAGCVNTTREGKSLCSDHIEQSPYAIQIRLRLEQRDAEDQRVTKLGPKAMRLDSMTVEEILLQLSIQGSRSVERLAVDLNIERETMLQYAHGLRKANLVTFSLTKRGGTVLNPKLPMLSPEFREADAAAGRAAMKRASA